MIILWLSIITIYLIYKEYRRYVNKKRLMNRVGQYGMKGYTPPKSPATILKLIKSRDNREQ